MLASQCAAECMINSIIALTEVNACDSKIPVLSPANVGKHDLCHSHVRCALANNSKKFRLNKILVPGILHSPLGVDNFEDPVEIRFKEVNCAELLDVNISSFLLQHHRQSVQSTFKRLS